MEIDRRSYTYATRQIGIHWLVVGLVAFQFLTGGGMAHAFERGLSLSTGATGTALVHGLIGTLILFTMIARVITRREHGAPPPPDTETRAIQRVSRANHALFYVVLIAMPLAGILAVLTGSELLAEGHAVTSKLLIALIVAHVAGAAWHLFKRDGVVSRMIPKRSA